MSQLDAFKMSKAIRDRLVDFALDDNFSNGPRITEICRRLWSGPAERGGLVSDLWVEGAFPSKAAEESLADLASQGLFDGGLQDHLHARGAVPRDRKLYLHQREAIIEAQKDVNNSRPALVITAGTGAGKTESFLLPVLNDLFKDRGAAKDGIKCLILYPMNALVNDQVDRIHEWLKDQEDLTLFHFTSETPEDSRSANAQQYPKWENEPFRIRTRQEARGLETHSGKRINLNLEERGRVPDILITNYSMLEYMLCRPQDSVFFGSSLRAVVLDEAHLYTGTLAAEITLLLRRLLRRCGVKPEQILQLATSATLGTGEGGELENFASILFSKPQTLVKVIRGEVQKAVLPEPVPASAPVTAEEMAQRNWLTVSTQSADGKSLLRDPEACRGLLEDLALLVGNEVIEAAYQNTDGHPAILLHSSLGHAPVLQKAVKIIEEKKRLPLSALAGDLWGKVDDVAQKATISLLQMGASARKLAGGYPILPHRLHLLARPADGIGVCLNDNCSGDPELKIDGWGCVIAGYSDHCLYCQSKTLSLYRCGNCGQSALAGKEDKGDLIAIPSGDFETKPQVFSISWVPGAPQISIEIGEGIRKQLSSISSCPYCDPQNLVNNKIWQPFMTSAPLTLSILSETALAELPEMPVNNNLWLPARGRRLLAFSDSQQEAARLGPRLRLQHEIQLVRAALARCAQQTPAADESLIELLALKVARLEQDLSAANLSPAVRQHYKSDLAQAQIQLTEAKQGGSVRSWLEMLKNDEGLHELLHVESSLNHQADYWGERTQRAWENNFSEVCNLLSILLGRELARTPPRREVNLETIGLVEVTYPGLDEVPLPMEFIGLLPIQTQEILSDVWPDFLAMLVDTIRTDGAVTLSEDGSFDQLHSIGNVPIGKWVAEDKTNGWWLIRFVGAREEQRRFRFAKTVLEKSGIPAERAEELASDLLKIAFKSLKNAAGQQLKWLKMEDQQTNGAPAPALQVLFPTLGLRRPLKLYRCEKTGQVWPRSVLGCSPESLGGTLVPVTEDELDNDPRIGRQRREYKESNVFRMALWAEEHSAQLSPKENRRLQDLFKLGARNVLSSTTTLELGIDIGGLNAVLMSNVPPGNANYLQRAGRAGRRADGSSVVMTYIRPRPFDREVFNRFGDFLGRSYRRPKIFLDRKRVISRHGNAYLLGEFFRQIYPPGTEVGAMSAFGNMGRFCGMPFIPFWENGSPKPPLVADDPGATVPASLPWFREGNKDSGLAGHFLDFLGYVKDSPDIEYKKYLNDLFKETSLDGLNSEWTAYFNDVIKSFERSINDWQDDYKNLLDSWNSIEEVSNTRPRAMANMLSYQSRALYETTVIEALADRQFLPRYGFPIGLQKLRVIQPDERNPGRIREEDQFRLERSGLLALREYVPGSQLLVGGKLITSRGLLKHWTGADLNNFIGLRGKYTRCKSGHIYYKISGQLGACPICEEHAGEPERELLFPSHGFTSAAWDPPRLSSSVEKVGSIERATITFAKSEGATDLSDNEFAGIQGLSAIYREAGEILVYNEGENGKGFAICLQCGYADSEEHLGSGKLPRGFDKHPRLTNPNKNSRCFGNNPAQPLRNQVLAARETTDVLLIGLSGPLSYLPRDEAIMQTLGYALQIAGAKIMELDSREIGVMVAPASEVGLGAVLYDNVPGGAGHVRELMARGREWLEAAKSVLYVNDEHHARCETACLDCLLTFDAQDAMRMGLLQRKKVYDILDSILSGRQYENDEIISSETDPTPQTKETANSGYLTNEERVQRAESRRQSRR